MRTHEIIPEAVYDSIGLSTASAAMRLLTSNVRTNIPRLHTEKCKIAHEMT